MATLSDQLSWIIFCNRCGLVLYRAQTKSEHGLYFPLGRRFLNQLTIPCLCCDCLRVFIGLTGAGAIGKTLAFFQIQNIGNNSRVNKSRII